MLHTFEPIPLKLAPGKCGRQIQILLGQEHFFHVIVDEVNVIGAVDGVKPNGLAMKLNQNHIRKRTRAQASRDCQMKPPANAAFFPLTLEFFKGQRRKTLVCPAAATALTDEYSGRS